MTEGIVVTIITGLLTILSTAISNIMSIGRTREQILYRLENLEKKQDKYNTLQERMVRVEESTKSAHKRIDEYGV